MPVLNGFIPNRILFVAVMVVLLLGLIQANAREAGDKA